MPVIPGNLSTTQTVQQLATQLKSNPEFYNLLGGAAGWSTEPLLTIANEIMSRILAENMPWKWNREIWPPFLTVALQQDYVSNIVDIGWFENGWLVDINNSVSNNNGATKPIRPLESVRDLTQTDYQGTPFQFSFVPNSQAYMGLWQANTAYGCGYGVPMLPRTPIQQFLDVNGNILFIDSTNLGLNIESPGYTGPTIIPPGFFPYGTSGSIQPAAPANATPGTLIQDGTVVWTVADLQNGYALRVSPVPALNGLTWLVVSQYQAAPPFLPTLQTPLSPIPTQFLYLFRAGCRAALTRENNLAKGSEMYAEWEEQLVKAIRGADRQQEDNTLVVCQSILGPNTSNLMNVGAAQPFGPSFFSPQYGQGW
jgi:hypothetical protein